MSEDLLIPMSRKQVGRTIELYELLQLPAFGSDPERAVLNASTLVVLQLALKKAEGMSGGFSAKPRLKQGYCQFCGALHD